MTKKVQGNTDFRKSNIQWYHQPAPLCFSGFSWWQDCGQTHQACILPGSSAVKERAYLSLHDHSRNLIGPGAHAPQPITVAETRQCSRWLSQSHMSVPDAGEKAGSLGKLRYQEKADWVLGGRNKDIHLRCEIGYMILFRVSASQWQHQAM